MPEKPESKQVRPDESRIGVYVCNCGGNIGDVVHCRQVAEALGRLPDVAVSRSHMFMCSVWAWCWPAAAPAASPIASAKGWWVPCRPWPDLPWPG
ncbi:MAG: hypothetical protein ACE5FD_19990 [Anaerolineae bacterium]